MSFTKRILAKFPLAKSGLEIFQVQYEVLVKPNALRFVLAAMFNLAGRFLGLLAFLISIQAIVVAFQYAKSGGTDFHFRSALETIGMPVEYVPILFPVLVFSVFSVPAFIKRIELKMLGDIVRDLHQRAKKNQAPLASDMFIVSNIPGHLTTVTQLASGVMVILASLVVVGIFRIDLFILVVLLSFTLSAVIVLLSFRKVNSVQELRQFKNKYVTMAHEKFRADTRAKKLSPIEEPSTVGGPDRNKFFERSHSIWLYTHKAGSNNGIVIGTAMAVIVWFVFSVTVVNQSQLIKLIYIVIAIRFSINTAQEVGNLLSKVLESRMHLDKLNYLSSMR